MKVTIFSAVLCVCLLAGTAAADMGLWTKASSLQFDYTYGPGGGGLMGTIDIVDNVASSLSVSVIDMGADGIIGTGDDTLVDLAVAGSDADFSLGFHADVFQLSPGVLQALWAIGA